MMRRVCSVWQLLFSIAVAGLPARGQVPGQVIAASGQPAPSLPPGVLLYSFAECQLNNAGQVAFIARLTDETGRPAGPERRGLFAGTATSFQLVAATGQPAAGTEPGVRFGLLRNVVLNERGEAGFLGLLEGEGVVFGQNQVGIWLATNGRLELAARSGDPAAGASEMRYRIGLDRFALNDQGQLAFSAGLGDRQTGIWTGVPGALNLVTRTGGPAPQTEIQVRSLNWPHQPLLNDFGELAFAAQLSIPAAGNPVVGYAGPPGAPEAVVWPGDPSPLPELVWGDIIATPLINNAGDVLVNAFVRDPVVGDIYRTLWLASPHSFRLLAREEMPAPGPSLPFGEFNESALNAAGQVAFVSKLRPVNRPEQSALFLADGRGLRLLAWNGAQAPGMPAGVVFGDADRDLPFTGPFMNARGQVAFGHTVSGPGISRAENVGLWASDTAGDVRLLARQGAPIRVGAGDSRSVRSMSLGTSSSSGREDGRGSPFNDRGQISVMLTWENNSAGPAVVAIVLLTVPQPSRLPAPQIVGDDLHLRVPTEAGKRYRLETAIDLRSGQWQSISEIEGTGSAVAVSDSGAALLRQRFYRLVQVD